MKLKTFLLTTILATPIVSAKDFLPPNLAFTPTLKNNQITIHIADGYYLYKDKVKIYVNSNVIPFEFNTKPISKNFKNYGIHDVFLDKAQISMKKIKSNEITLIYQGCSLDGLCYPPQQTILKLRK